MSGCTNMTETTPALILRRGTVARARSEVWYGPQCQRLSSDPEGPALHLTLVSRTDDIVIYSSTKDNIYLWFNFWAGHPHQWFSASQRGAFSRVHIATDRRNMHGPLTVKLLLNDGSRIIAGSLYESRCSEARVLINDGSQSQINACLGLRKIGPTELSE